MSKSNNTVNTVHLYNMYVTHTDLMYTWFSNMSTAIADRKTKAL